MSSHYLAYAINAASRAREHTPRKRNYARIMGCNAAVTLLCAFTLFGYLALRKTLAFRRETARTGPSTVTTYARLRVMVREGCAEAVPLGESASTKDARRLPR